MRHPFLSVLIASGIATGLPHGAPAQGLADQAPLDPSAFEAEVTGRTLTYAKDGAIYGIEQYLPGREVVWSFLDGTCETGRWYDIGDAICFLYDGRSSPICWHFFAGADGLLAQPTDDPAEPPAYEVRRSRAPLTCRGDLLSS